MSRGKKIALGVVVALLLLVFVIVPMVIGMFAKDKIIAGIQEAVGAPVKAGSVSVNLLPPGASISSLEIGAPDSAANNQPLAKIDSVSVSVTYGSVFGSDLHVTGCTVKGGVASISVDQNGQSSLAKLLDTMPPSKRTGNLPLDSLVVKNLRADVYMPNHPGPASTLNIDYAGVFGLELAPPGKPLGREIWARVNIEGLKLSAPPQGEDKNEGGGPEDGAALGKLDAEFAQSPQEGSPIKIKNLALTRVDFAQAYTGSGATPGVRRALQILPLGLQQTTKGGKAGGGVPQILVDKLTIHSGRLETRGPDFNGNPAHWRLSDIKGEGANIAFGPNTAAPAAGYFKLSSPSESSSGPGAFEFNFADMTGSYPKWTCQFSQKMSTVAAPPFSTQSKASGGPGIKAGHISSTFAGPIQNGRLQIDGEIQTSADLEVDGVLKRLTQNQTVKPVLVRGTLEKIDTQFPNIAGGLEKVMGAIITGGPIGITDVVGGIMGSSTEQGMREATKGLEKGQELLKKVPGIKGIFGK